MFPACGEIQDEQFHADLRIPLSGLRHRVRGLHPFGRSTGLSEMPGQKARKADERSGRPRLRKPISANLGGLPSARCSAVWARLLPDAARIGTVPIPADSGRPSSAGSSPARPPAALLAQRTPQAATVTIRREVRSSAAQPWLAFPLRALHDSFADRAGATARTAPQPGDQFPAVPAAPAPATRSTR